MLQLLFKAILYLLASLLNICVYYMFLHIDVCKMRY